MPILELQRRLREAGRIRIGEKKTNANGKTYPAKLSTFRLTSRDATILTAAAQQWGGTVRPWDGQYEVVTETDRLEVVVPPADMAWSQFYELWSGGGCLRRCDGATELIGDQPCLCDPEHRDCNPHSRLSLMLPDLPTVGLWRLDTSGWNAATELAGSVDLARAFAERGTYLPAELRLEQREKKVAGEGTRKFAVPILDLKVSMRALGNMTAEPVYEVEAARFTPVPAELPEAPVPPIAEQLAPKPRKTRTNSAVEIPPTGLKPKTRSAAESTPAAENEVGEAPATVGASQAGPLPGLDPAAQERAERIATVARANGFNDQKRHAFILEFSGGAYSSAHDVPVEDVNRLCAAFITARRERERVL